MNVLVIGSGGREHALAWKIAQSPLLTKLYLAPGNAGMHRIGECVPIKADDLESLAAFAKNNQIDLTVVGPEAPLVKGIVDRFQREGLNVFGPVRSAAQLEASKVFSKRLMREAGVPTADFEVFDDAKKANDYVHKSSFLVVKSDGLAAGKGVIVAGSRAEAAEAIQRMMVKCEFGDAGKRIVIEECLRGEELSVLVLTDGERAIPLASSQDHKRAFDHDQGPNTGGMGAYSPSASFSEEKLEEIVRLTAKPILDLLRKQGAPYRGILYVGIMMTDKGPFVLEYNVRFGDPETQAVLPRLKTDLLPLLDQVARGKLDTMKLEWDSRACVSVVMASRGYPGSYQTGFEISGIAEAETMPDVTVFHAGTAMNTQGKVCTAGGRVLNVSALGNSAKAAQEQAYEAVRKISFEGAMYRHDIAKQALARNAYVHH